MLYKCRPSQENCCRIRNGVKLLVKVIQHRYIFSGLVDRKKTYHGRNLVGYSCTQMFDVVSDVKNYKKFVPFCQKSLILYNKDDFMKAELEIGFSSIIERYTSNVTCIKPILVSSTCSDGLVFNFLDTKWKFSRGLKSNPKSCIVDFSIEFEFKSFLYAHLTHIFFERVVKQMEGAFIREAKRRYGPESLPSHPLAVN